MKIALVGATDFVGLALLEDALDRGIPSQRLCPIRRSSKREDGSLQKLATFMRFLFL